MWWNGWISLEIIILRAEQKRSCFGQYDAGVLQNGTMDSDLSGINALLETLPNSKISQLIMPKCNNVIVKASDDIVMIPMDTHVSWKQWT